MMSEVKIQASRYEELKQRAEEEGRPVQQLIDEALIEFLKSTE